MTTVYRPSLDVYTSGGSYVYTDADGNVMQVVGTQADGTFGVTAQNGAPPPQPSVPTVTAATQGLAVAWDGTLVDTTPLDFDHVEVHVSETAGFTPDSTTLAGTLTHAGSFPVTPLDGGTEYFVRLVGVNTSGVAGPASAQASGTPSEVVATSLLDGIVTTLALADDAVTQAKIAAAAVGSAEIQGAAVDLSKLANGSVDATKLVAGAVGSNALQAGAVVAGKVAAGAIGTNELAANSVVAGKIAASAVTAGTLAAGSVQAGNLAAGAVQAGQIAANAVTTANLQALAVTAAQIAANTITAGQLAAGSVTADKIAATLLLASQIIAGATAGTRVVLDATGIHAYDADNNSTVVIGSDGSAQFQGASVSADEIDAETIVINSPTDGGLFIYGSSNTPLNSNPNFTASTAGWTSTATTITYSSVHTFNGHSTMRCQRSGGAATAETSTAVTVIPGTQYQVAATMLSSDSTPMYAQIRFKDASGVDISHVTSPASTSTSFTTGLVVVAGIAPAGAATASIRLGFTVSSAGAFYVGSAGITATNTFSSLTNDPGTDAFGNAYPAGLQTAAANIGKLSAGNMNWGPSSTPTNSSGQVVINHGLGHDPNSIQITPTINALYRPVIANHDAATITVGFKDASNATVTTGGHAANFYWFAAV